MCLDTGAAQVNWMRGCGCNFMMLSDMDEAEYRRLFDLMAFQRNVKAVGTFCYQTAVIGNRAFEHSIAPTLGYLREYIAARPELAEAGRLLEPIMPGISR